jgi:hypothetical protein
VNEDGMWSATAEQTLDFDLHGIVGIRVVNARAEDARMVREQLGPTVRPLDRPPDLTVRFMPQRRMPRLRYIEPGRSGFTDDGYYVLSHRRRPVVARMPFDATADTEPRYVIECEHGARAVPMLEEWVRLIALARGYVPLHASAFQYHGTGVIVAGAPHGGKTSCLLAFAGTGARFVSDDLLLLSGDGGTMLGFATDISVADWQLDQLPGFRRRLGPLRRALLAGARQLERMQPVAWPGWLGTLGHTAVPALRRRLKVSLPPDALFQRVGSCVADTGAVFLTLSHASPEILVEPVDPASLAGRLAAALRLQLHPLFEHYLGYRFAFPQRTSELLETAESQAYALLRRGLRGRDSFVLRHPHPVSLEELRRAMRPFVDGTPATASGADGKRVPLRAAAAAPAPSPAGGG